MSNIPLCKNYKELKCTLYLSCKRFLEIPTDKKLLKQSEFKNYDYWGNSCGGYWEVPSDQSLRDEIGEQRADLYKDLKS